jgi:hypothetical protein
MINLVFFSLDCYLILRTFCLLRPPIPYRKMKAVRSENSRIYSLVFVGLLVVFFVFFVNRIKEYGGQDQGGAEVKSG